MTYGPDDRPDFATNDSGTGETVAGAVNSFLKFSSAHEQTGRSIAIASAYFNVGGWYLLAPELTSAGSVRILLGAEPQRKTDPVLLRPTSTPRQKASRDELGDALQEQAGDLATERNLLPFTREARGQVQEMIDWLRSGVVEVRRYTKEFLHGKAYIVDQPELGVIAGSSNFTHAGLSKNRELNLGQHQPHATRQVIDWFNGLWGDAEPFDLAGFYEEQVIPLEPWLVFLRMLWEAYGGQMAQDEEDIKTDPSMRDLMEFQRDGVGRARRILEKRNGVLIADEVGLGKTYVGGALVKDTARERRRVLIIAPKIIRDTVWKPYVDREHLGGWVDAISYDDLLAEPTPDGRIWHLDVARDPDEYSLVVLDEAHTVRNNDTQRAQALVDILKGNPRKRVALLTATPVNNSLGDLHSLLSYFIVHDDEFAEIGIPSLSTHFKELDKLGTDDLSPEQLFDVLDAVAVRRTRQFVRHHYIGQRLEKDGLPLSFPEPTVERVDYSLAPLLTDSDTGHSFFDTFAHALGADSDDDDVFFSGRIPDEGLSSLDVERLTLAGYTPSRYQVSDDDLDRRQRAAEVQVSGLLRTGLLKRLESSTRAFVLTCRKMAGTLEGLLGLINEQGLVASGDSLRDWIRLDITDDLAHDSWKESADFNSAQKYNIRALVVDIKNDIRLLRSLAATVEDATTVEQDPKFEALAEMLADILDQASSDERKRQLEHPELEDTERAQAARDDRKTLVFSYFADTIDYIQDNIDTILDDPRLEPYRGRVAFVSGSGRKTAGRDQRPLSVEQDVAVAGFAPRTGGAVDASGTPVSEDAFDLLFTTDVLSQGVNLQQARNVASIDLPWNPQVLVQRHGRIDRIGSHHDRIYVWCFFPDSGLDEWLGLEQRLHLKLAKAAASIGHGRVLPGVAASDDRVFNNKTEQIRALQSGDTTLFTGQDASLMSGEEFRAMLRRAVENASLERTLESMAWSVGSGFTTDDRVPGYVFCARILNKSDEPVFRYVPLPASLIPGGSTTALTAPDPDSKYTLQGTPITVIDQSLTALTMANPPSQDAPAHLPPEWLDLAYDAWEAARQSIADMWNDSLDAQGNQPNLAPPIRKAIKHLQEHNARANTDDVDKAIKVYRRGQASRVATIVRAVLNDEAMTDDNKTTRLIELVDELGLVTPDAREQRFSITPEDVHLIAWMAIQPIKPNQ